MAQAKGKTTPKAEKIDAQQLRKLTIKAVCGEMDIERIIAEKKIPLCDIFGIANRTKVIDGDYGASVRFIGQFRGINLETGEVFQSTRLYMPSMLEEELSTAMAAAAKASEGGTGAQVNAEFGVRIYVLFDKKLATKYYFDAENIVQPQKTDALDNLMQRVMENRLLLEAPKKAA